MQRVQHPRRLSHHETRDPAAEGALHLSVKRRKRGEISLLGYCQKPSAKGGQKVPAAVETLGKEGGGSGKARHIPIR